MSAEPRGRLFYVIGPSGSGKDSLMRYARQHLLERPVIFAHRYITRAVELEGENHICLTLDEFEQRLGHGLFAMHWASHGLHYGIGIEIDTWMDEGLDVVVNGSRAWLHKASERYPGLVPVLVWAPQEVLESRLVARQRESAEDVVRRLERAAEYEHIDHPALVSLRNDNGLEETGEAFIRLFDRA